MKYIMADAHTDFLSHANDDERYIHAGKSGGRHVSKEGMLEGNVGLQIFAAFTDSGSSDPTVGALKQISTLKRVRDAWGNMELLDRGNIANLQLAEGKLFALAAIEGGEALKGSEKVYECFLQLGVRLITLTWNYENEIAYPASSGGKNRLKPFGKQLIKRMNVDGVAVDVSHLNEAGFWDAIELSERPIIASHSNAYSLCPHARNLTDEQIKAIVDVNGYIGLNFYTSFLTVDRVSHIEDIVKHAHHILELGGENVLGMGSDFDGIQSMPEEITGVQDFQMIMQALADSGIKEEILQKIAHGNMVRYLKNVMA